MVKASENGSVEQTAEEAIFLAARRPVMKPGDYLRLADVTLLEAYRGTRALRRAEREALQQSPLTQARLRQLIAGAIAAEGSPVLTSAPTTAQRTPAEAANDAFWVSTAWLRAADSGGPLPELLTDDRVWALTVTANAEAGKANLCLRLLDIGAPWAEVVLGGSRAVELRDVTGAVLLRGVLDREGELAGPWPLEIPFEEHIRLVGGWEVRVPK